MRWCWGTTSCPFFCFSCSPLHIERALTFIKLQGTLRSWSRRCHNSVNSANYVMKQPKLDHWQWYRLARQHKQYLIFYFGAIMPCWLINIQLPLINVVSLPYCVIPFLLLHPTAFCKRQNNSICHKTSNILYIRINKRQSSPFFIYPLLLLSSEHLHLTFMLLPTHQE